MTNRKRIVGWYPHTRNPKVASLRLRCLMPMKELVRRGYDHEMYNSSRKDQYDVVIFNKAYSEAALAEAVHLKKKGVTLVLDICDNYFYNPNNLEYWVKAGNRLKRMIALCDHIVASTSALARIVSAECGYTTRITVIGDAAEDFSDAVPKLGIRKLSCQLKTAYYRARIENLVERERRFPLVWFGNHGGPNSDYGGMADLNRVRMLLQDLNNSHPLMLTVISNNKGKFRKLVRDWPIPLIYIEWDSASFLSILRMHRVSIIPVTRNPFTESKTNNRLALSLKESLAVVADSIESYREFDQCCVLDNWKDGLLAYLKDPALRARHIRAGQKLLSEKWTINKVGDAWETFFCRL